MNEEIMTDKHIKTFLKMVKQIIDDSDSKEDASKKIDELINDYK